MADHTIWMSMNCGVPDGGCDGCDVRPDGGFRDMSFTAIGRLLGLHLDRLWIEARRG